MDYLKKYLLIFMALLVLAVVAVAVLAPRKTDAELQDLYVDASSITSSRASDLLDQLKEAEPSTPRPMADDSEFADEADSDIDAAAHAADSLDGAGSSEAGAALQAILDPSDTIRARNQFESHLDDMPPGGIRLKVNSVGGALGRVLNDSNYLHIATAGKIGIKPVNSLRDAWEGGRKLERLRSCENYYLDHLTHSLPYLTPRAHKLINDIGSSFRDSLRARGGGDYRIKITSVLRTPRLIRRLRRRNGNAVDTSAHLFGTTFDISYAKFICDSTRVPRTQEDLKNLLGEVVADFRARGRCYVKFERKQACFHITAR